MKKFIMPIILVFIVLLSGCNIKAIEFKEPIEEVALAYTLLQNTETLTGVSKQVVLTIMPINAYYKTVSWTAEWDANAVNKNNNVYDYIQPMPLETDNKIANINCLQPFGNDIIYIKAKPDSTELTATITVKYIGLPNDITLNKDPQDPTVGVEEYKGTTYIEVWSKNKNLRKFDIVPLFPFEVNNNYIPEYELVNVYIEHDLIYRIGHFNTSKNKVDWSGSGNENDPMATNKLAKIIKNDYSIKNQYADDNIRYFPLSDIIQVKILNNVLSLQVTNSVYERIGSSLDTDYLYWFYDENDPYNLDKFYCYNINSFDQKFYIKIRDKKSKIEKTIIYKFIYAS